MTSTNYNIHTHKQSHRLSTILSLWVYIYAFFYFIPLIIPSNSYLMHVVLLVMAILIVMNTMKVRISLLIFTGCYIITALFNISIVSYSYYVAVDAFSGLALFLPALLVISSDKFDLFDFSVTWSRLAIKATIFSPIAIVLMQAKYIDYGVFNYLNLPNAMIFSYMAMISSNKKQTVTYYALAIVNFLVILLFGGRMAAFTAAFSIFMGYMLSGNIRLWKKILMVILAISSIILLLIYIEEILTMVQSLLDKYNLSSRSVALLLEQLKTNELYLSRRNIIYDEVIDYISSRSGLPGGFGVSLAISNGKFYHPHNLILQLSVMFGVVGTVVFLLLVICKLLRQKMLCRKEEYNFMILFLVDYILISLSGGSILTSFVSIIGLGMVFFYKTKKSNQTWGENLQNEYSYNHIKIQKYINNI